MSTDLNLLVTLDVLLDEGSVARAARRRQLSPSAMSRSLARLREATGDPLLVRAGRGLVPTPRAAELRGRVGTLLREVQGVLRPVGLLDLGRVERTFTIRSSDGFVENFGAGLIERVGRDAPRARLRFIQKTGKDSALLREGLVDLETGVVDREIGPEVRAQGLFKDRLVGVIRNGHALCKGTVTAARYTAARHVLVTRRGIDEELGDDAILRSSKQREIVAIVGGFSAALALARRSDLIATVPERHTTNLRSGMFTFPLPVRTHEFVVSLLWHPRMDADPAHRWLRGCAREACAREHA